LNDENERIILMEVEKSMKKGILKTRFACVCMCIYTFLDDGEKAFD